MVGQILPLTKSNLTSDAADALAIALCHHNRNRI
jgi:Holliday junction resolvasome RuvABC endonuclease subunit